MVTRGPDTAATMSPSTRLFPRLVAALTAVLSLTLHPAAARAPQDPGQPRLVVLLMVDQMRADYIPRYADLLQSGLRRLTTQGAWYQNAAFPYLNTVTCAGHSTAATGSFPYRHGMIMNGWFVRDAGVTETCTEDPATAEISYGTLKGPGESAKRLLQPTLAELMHRGGARTASLSSRRAARLLCPSRTVRGARGCPGCTGPSRPGQACSCRGR
jgi:hypothetical protein